MSRHRGVLLGTRYVGIETKELAIKGNSTSFLVNGCCHHKLFHDREDKSCRIRELGKLWKDTKGNNHL